MTELRIVTLNGGERDKETNAPIADAFTQLTDDATDEKNREPAGLLPLMSCLGITALPYPPTKEGHAEGIAAENVGGLPGVCVAGWDTRCASITCNAKPGDTILHSTGPNKAAQVQCKEEKRQLVICTQDVDGNQQIFLLDGKNKKVQILANGAIWQIDEKGNTDICSPNGGNGITVSNDAVWLRGTVILGGANPVPAMFSIMLGPIAGSPGGPASVPLTAAKGVFIGQ